MIRLRHLLMNAYILTVRAGVDIFLLVNSGLRDAQPVVLFSVVRKMAVLTQRMILHWTLMMLLDLPLLWR